MSCGMQRVVILGCGGAGKSTLARRLGERTGLPVFHLDCAFWKPGWVESSKEEFAARHDELLKGERWIIDGNYSRTLQRRAAAADTVLLLDLPRWRCMIGILARYVKGRGRTRPDMAPDCPEKLDWEFIKWVWHFRARSRMKHLHFVESLRTTKAVYILRSRGEVRRWLNDVPENTQ